MLFDAKRGACSYDVVREGEEVILTVDCERCSYVPSLEDNPLCMARTVDKLAEVGGVTKIVFSQKRNYEYEQDQVKLLAEIAQLYRRLVKEKERFGYNAMGSGECKRCTPRRYNELWNIIFNRLKADPLGAYVEVKRILRREHIQLERLPQGCISCTKKYISLLSYLIARLEHTALVRLAQPYLAGYKLGERGIYRRMFSPTIKPDFMFTKLMASYPVSGEEVDAYVLDNNTEVTIFKLPKNIQYLYHVLPPEFKLSEEKYDLLDVARRIITEHKPEKSEFVDPERMRQVFSNVGHDLLEELSENYKVKLRNRELDELTNILVRYTVGFGLIEVLLRDDRIQDVTINSPMGHIPMFIVHQDYGECFTNIIPTPNEAESWASKLRMISGRPLDEANPIMDTELLIPGARARVAVIAPPLNPNGLAYALRRHRDMPWTLPLFIRNRMISPLAAGIMSFLIDGSRTLLVAGTRSAGKTSFLGSIMTEIMRKYRIITIEDTLELPVSPLSKLGYNIQSLKVASAMTSGTTEVGADEGIRTTLRLGDSCLIVGEVRSTEAKALYEAMRVGALANVVAGTIHGDSPYGVYDRVVNDLGVQKTSFKATDIIIVANPIKSPDGLHTCRRVTQITEVRKFWDNDPLAEHGFADLLKYDPKTDQLEPTKDLLNGDSDVLKGVAGRVNEWAGNWDAVWDNIMLRTRLKESLVSLADQAKMPGLLEAGFVVQANDEFHRISDRIRDEVGSLDSKRIEFEWGEWLKGSVKKINLEKG